MTTAARVGASLRRRPGDTGRVTQIELFFDLVYVFAITQLSHVLAHLGVVRSRGRTDAGRHRRRRACRKVLWALAVTIELVGAAVGFRTPGLGRSETREWTIDGGHFAERCQAFVLIALGESIVITGTTIAGHPGAEVIAAFVVAFAASVALWWVYFDRAAADSAQVIDESDDPGRLGRNAFHWVHPVIVAGIIVDAAATERVLEDPSAPGGMATAWLTLGGTALFLAGHAIFKAVVWRVVSWPRVIAVAVLLALFALAPHVTALMLSVTALVVVVGVAAADRLHAVAAPA